MVESTIVKSKRPGVFMEVLRYRQRFIELDQSSADNVECRCNFTMNMRTVQGKEEGSQPDILYKGVQYRGIEE